jgi:hypothetical protein
LATNATVPAGVVVRAEDKAPGEGITEGQYNQNSDGKEGSTPATPMLSGMLSGKVRPAPREPDVTHYRDKGADDGSR